MSDLRRRQEREMADKLAEQQAAYNRRLEFQHGLLTEAHGLTHNQRLTRAFAFSYIKPMPHFISRTR
jgi:hypothetical protein